MFDWLFDGCLQVFLVLGATGTGLAVAWWRTRHRGYVYSLVVVIILAGVYVGLTLLYGETAKEQIKRRVLDIESGVRADDMNRVFSNFSEKFQVKGSSGSFDKQSFRKAAEEAIRKYGQPDFVIDQIEVGTIDREKGVGKVGFIVKVAQKGGGDPLFICRCVGTFVREDKNQWRLQTFELFNYVNANDQIPVPF
ncbi:MAG: hypothetical protein ACJ8FY_22180 [Gemmataceae bacterium]